MEAYYRQRDDKITLKVILDLKKGFIDYNDNKITLNEIGTSCPFDDTLINETSILEEIYYKYTSTEVFIDVYEIGKKIESFTDINKFNLPKFRKFFFSDEYIEKYKKIIEKTLGDNNAFNNLSQCVIDFTQKYGAFMTIPYKSTYHKQTFNFLDFLLFCYLVFEVSELFNRLLKGLKVNLKIFNYYYNDLKLNVDYKDEDYNFSYDIDEVYDLIQDRLNYFDKKQYNKMRLLSVRNSVFDAHINEYSGVENTWKTVMFFSSPLGLAIYELQSILSNDSETSWRICKNPECSNYFVINRIDGERKREYCNEPECNQSRARQRKNKSINNKKKKNI